MHESIIKHLNGTKTITDNINLYIEAFVELYGEQYRDEITNRLSNILIIGYNTRKQKSNLINKIIKEESFKVQKKLIEKYYGTVDDDIVDIFFGYGFNCANIYHIEKFKKYHELMKKGKRTRENEFLKAGHFSFCRNIKNITFEEYMNLYEKGIESIDLSKVNSLFINDLNYFFNIENAENDLIRYRKEAVEFLNKLGINTTIDTIDQDYMNNTFSNIIKLADHLDEMDIELTTVKSFVEPYLNHEIEINHKSDEINKRYQLKLLMDSLSYFSEDDKKIITSELEKNNDITTNIRSIPSFIIYVQKDYGAYPLIEAFADEYDLEVNDLNNHNWRTELIRNDRIKYFKLKGLDLGDDYAIYLISDEAKKIWPGQDLVNTVMDCYNKNLNMMNQEVFELEDEVQDTIKLIKEKGFLDHDISYNGSLEKHPMTCLNPNITYSNGQFYLDGMVLINITESESLDHNIAHELNHVLELSLINVSETEYEVLCGWDHITGLYNEAQTTTNTPRQKKRQYELFNEAINEMLAQRVSQIMYDNGYFVFNTKDNCKFKYTTSYERNIAFLNEFFETYRDIIIQSRWNGNIQLIYDAVGKNNFDDLNSLIIELNDRFPSFSYYGVLSDYQNNIQNENTLLFKELLKRREQILQNMREFNVEKTR